MKRVGDGVDGVAVGRLVAVGVCVGWIVAVFVGSGVWVGVTAGRSVLVGFGVLDGKGMGVNSNAVGVQALRNDKQRMISICLVNITF